MKNFMLHKYRDLFVVACIMYCTLIYTSPTYALTLTPVNSQYFGSLEFAPGYDGPDYFTLGQGREFYSVRGNTLSMDSSFSNYPLADVVIDVGNQVRSATAGAQLDYAVAITTTNLNAANAFNNFLMQQRTDGVYFANAYQVNGSSLLALQYSAPSQSEVFVSLTDITGVDQFSASCSTASSNRCGHSNYVSTGALSGMETYVSGGVTEYVFEGSESLVAEASVQGSQSIYARAFIDPVISLNSQFLSFWQSQGGSAKDFTIQLSDGVANASLVAAVPEPSTEALLLTGLGLMGMLSYRSKKIRNWS